MINTKKVYNTLLNDSRITALIPEDSIFNAYPDEIENFPCLVFLDDEQADTEYYENMPGASYCSVQVHIFTKKLDGYVSSAEVAIIVAEVMNEDLWNCSQNGEVQDSDPNVEHRVMRFGKSIFN